jgi:hypothetical protein
MFRDPSSRLHHGQHRLIWLSYIGLVLLAAVVIQRRGATWSTFRVETARNFYGVLSLYVRHRGNMPTMNMELMHGQITHGIQFADDSKRGRPTSYYAEETGVGLLLRHPPTAPPLRVGVVGLGVGTVAAYGKPGDVYRFYEINPQVVAYAQNSFTYLEESKAKVEVVLGDARLSLEREPPQDFDVLVLDAFSGDAVPMHLLTREAFAIYDRHLADRGVIAVHITNRHLDLTRVLRPIQTAYGYKSVLIETGRDDATLIWDASWVLLARNQESLAMPALSRVARPLGDETAGVLWTDEYTSLLPVLK